MGITDGVKGMRVGDLPRKRGANVKRADDIPRDVAWFKDPKFMTTIRAVRMHLCAGANSPCEKCDVMCGYGKRYLQLQAGEK